MLSYFFPPHYSGSAVQAQSLCRHLSKINVDSVLLSANLTGSASSEVVGGVRVRRLRILDVRNLRVLSFWLSAGWFLITHRRTYDLLHAHGTFQHGVAAFIGRILGKPSVLKVAMAKSDIAFDRQGRLMGRLNRLVVRQFTRVIATSREVLAECAAEGLPAMLIRNGVDTDRFRPADDPEERRRLRRQLGLPEVPIVAFLGVMNPRKNVDAILRVWRQVTQRVAAAHLIMIGPMQKDPEGRTTAYCRELERFVSENDLDGSVTFSGAQTDVELYLRCADIFYFPSKQEGMPNALLEAMATGLPAVVSDTCGAGDLIDDGRNGHIIELRDEARQAAIIEWLLSNADERIRIGAEARKFILASASLSSTAQEYRRLYQELLEERYGDSTGISASRNRHDDP